LRVISRLTVPLVGREETLRVFLVEYPPPFEGLPEVEDDAAGDAGHIEPAPDTEAAPGGYAHTGGNDGEEFPMFKGKVGVDMGEGIVLTPSPAFDNGKQHILFTAKDAPGEPGGQGFDIAAALPAGTQLGENGLGGLIDDANIRGKGNGPVVLWMPGRKYGGSPVYCYKTTIRMCVGGGGGGKSILNK
jgi:hypothetical protein